MSPVPNDFSKHPVSIELEDSSLDNLNFSPIDLFSPKPLPFPGSHNSEAIDRSDATFSIWGTENDILLPPDTAIAANPILYSVDKAAIEDSLDKPENGTIESDFITGKPDRIDSSAELVIQELDSKEFANNPELQKDLLFQTQVVGEEEISWGISEQPIAVSGTLDEATLSAAIDGVEEELDTDVTDSIIKEGSQDDAITQRPVTDEYGEIRPEWRTAIIEEVAAGNDEVTDSSNAAVSGKPIDNLSNNGETDTSKSDRDNSTIPVDTVTDKTGTDTKTFIADRDAAEPETDSEIDLILSETSIPKLDFTSGVFTVGESGEVGIDFIFDGGKYQGELAIFSLEGMEDFDPSDVTGFIREAARRASSNSELGYVVISDSVEGAKFSGGLRESNFNSGIYRGTKTFTMRSGNRFAVMLVPNATVAQVLEDPHADCKLRPLFSLVTANPHEAFHLGQIADATGGGTIFALEDLRMDGNSDRDYNDIIFQVTGATGNAVHLDEVINPAKDWRNTERGKEILASVALPPIDVDPDIDPGDVEPDIDPIDVEPDIDPVDNPIDDPIYVDPDIDPVDDPIYVEPDIDPIDTEPDIDPIYINPNIDPDLTLNPGQPTSIDLSQVFIPAAEGEPIGGGSGGAAPQYDILAGNSNTLNVELDGDTLTIVPTPDAETGITPVAIRVTDASGNSVTTTVSVVTNNLPPDAVSEINTALTNLSGVIGRDGILGGLDTETGGTALERLGEVVEKYKGLVSFLDKPELLVELGVKAENVEPLKALLNSEELARDLGLDVTLSEALSQPDTSVMDRVLMNANDAIAFLPDNAIQPTVGFLDFAGDHLNDVTTAFTSINPDRDFQTFTLENGNWSVKLVEFVDRIRAAGETHAIVNLSFDLSQLDDIGITTRYELTPAEQQAIAYARDNNVLLVVAAGNTGSIMSALGAASQQFDNIITVGAVTQFERKADYSSYGDGLTIVAPGGVWDDDSDAFIGTSKATSYITAAASLIWAANPKLNFLQVKQILIDTAVDLDLPGWDKETGAGLVDINEAIQRAQLTEAAVREAESTRFEPVKFSGEGRVNALERAAGDGTQTAIEALENTQEIFIEQWLTLLNLGNPELDLPDLDTAVQQKIAEALETYKQVSTAAGVTDAQQQQLTEALTLATQHYQIELTRLKGLEQEKQQLEASLANLGQQKEALQTETQQRLDSINQQITQAAADLEQAKAKLLHPFADADDSLQTDPTAWQQAAAEHQNLFQQVANQAAIQAAETERYTAIANSIVPTERWQMIGTQTNRSNRTTPIWGQVTDKQAIQQKNQATWQAQIAAQNQQSLQQLAEQVAQNVAVLENQMQLAAEQRDEVNVGNVEDVTPLLEFLNQQALQQEEIAKNYAQQAAIAASRYQQNQDLANWHNSQANRWQQIGTKQTGRSPRKTEPVYGWVSYPEHIAPRDNAQQLANEAKQEQEALTQLALQAEQQANSLKEQARQLQERLRDWSTLKAGIDAEIVADEWRLQANRDLLAMHDPVQQQKLESLEQLIQQTQTQLDKLNGEKISQQQNLTGETQQRLAEISAQWQEIELRREAAKQEFQAALEVTGFLLPYWERLATIEKQIDRLESEKLAVLQTMQNLTQQLVNTPSDSLAQQLQNWQGYLEKINQELEWTTLQKGYLSMALSDSPERLALANLIRDLENLEEASSTAIEADAKINMLKSYESGGAEFLEGFDNLTDRLNAAKTELANTELELTQLKKLYVELGLEKAALEDTQIPVKQQQIAAKDTELAATAAEIAATEQILQTQQAELAELQDLRSQQANNIQIKESEISATQTEIANLQTQIEAKDSDIQQQQFALQNDRTQISQANAAVAQFEQQRQQHQNTANYWNSQINTWGIVGYRQERKRNVPVYGNIYNPQAEANRNASQAAANQAAQQRDVAQVEAQQLAATLQPKIAITEATIAKLQNEKQGLVNDRTALETQLNTRKIELQTLQQEQALIEQKVNLQTDEVLGIQTQRDRLNTQQTEQQQQRDTLAVELANLQQEKAGLEDELSETYDRIDLTSRYLQQVKLESDRLQSRQDILARSGILEQTSADTWTDWKTTVQTQAQTIANVLQIREIGASDRQNSANSQTQLTQIQTNLEQVKTLHNTLEDAQYDLTFTQLQLGNQNLLLQSLLDRDPTLAQEQAKLLTQSQLHQQKTWYWNGKEWAYNPTEAAAARANLEQASLIAELRNKQWQQQQETRSRIDELTQQISATETQITDIQTQLAATGEIAQLETQIIDIQTQIQAATTRLQPLQTQETQLNQTLQTTATQLQHLNTELIQTTNLQSDALRQFIGLGMLASESDVDFFGTQVEPKVKQSLEQFTQRSADIAQQIETLQTALTQWQTQRDNTTDETSKQTLTELIAQIETQLTDLQQLQTQTQTANTDLQTLFNTALNALMPLRQKQELEIRQKLEENSDRLDTLQSQLATETAAAAAIQTDTILAYAQLHDTVRQDLTAGVADWTQHLLDGNSRTKDLITTQKDLSESADNLIAEITGEYAQPDSNYHQSAADLRDGINILEVLENRTDALDSTVDSTTDAIAQIKLRLQQDVQLGQLLAPIAARYGAESEELQQYQAQLQAAAQNATKALPEQFISAHPDNASTIDLLITQTLNGSTPDAEVTTLFNAQQADSLLNADAPDGRNPLQALTDKAQAMQAQLAAQGHAQLAQAQWYEQQAAYYWSVSRQNGPYWTEQRWVKGRSGKGHWETITHVDHYWILWNQYSKLAPQLRTQAMANLAAAEQWGKAKERFEPLAQQWTEANEAANLAQPDIEEARNFFAELEAARESIGTDTAQLATLETLLPIVEQQLAQAEAEAAAQNDRVREQWAQYDTDSEEYRSAIADLLQRRGELNQQAIAAQEKLAETERWVERESVALGTQLEGTLALITQLQQHQAGLQAQPLTEELSTKLAQLDRTLDLLSNKATILTAQQTALTQKRTLLTAQNEVILAEQRLLDAYALDPDADTSTLEQQLADTRAALAEAQRLAEQAEAASAALTAPLQQIQAQLLAQNDAHLQLARENQTLLKELVEATQHYLNYTLLAAQKQQEVNGLELQILQRLQEATAAGSQEAKHLLDVAKYNDMATAAEIYYRDYSDLAGDRGGCAGGAGRAEDQILANRYYQAMLANRELQHRAQEQVNAFRVVKETAEAQIKTLQTQQEMAAQALAELNAKLAQTQEEREQLQQDLAVAQARLDGIARIREQTEQTFTQMVALEQLNLTQAQLEQQIADARQAELEQAVRERMEREMAEVERQRTETRSQIEQLEQLLAEDELRQNLNVVRGELGLATLEPTEDTAQISTQLATLLGTLTALESEQPDLPDDLKALLVGVRNDIHLALQGEESARMQENLLNAMAAMVGQVQQYKTEINRIELEAQWDSQLLQTAQTDLQKASQELLEELARSEELTGEQGVINPLYLEVLNRVALAEQAVDLSTDLGQQSKEILEQIIDQRIEQREQRQKMFWIKILGIIRNIIGILGFLLKFTPLAPLGIALSLASTGIGMIQSAISGDWSGAIFQGVMAGLSFLTSAIPLPPGMNIAIQSLMGLAQGSFDGIRSIMSGEGIVGFLQILGGVASAITTGLSSFINSTSDALKQVVLQVFNSLKTVPLQIYGAIEGIKNGDWVAGIGNILNAVGTLGSNFAGIFNDTAAKVFGVLNDAGSSAQVIGKAIEEGGISGWLSGINGMLGIWGDDLVKLVDRLKGEPIDLNVVGQGASNVSGCGGDSSSENQDEDEYEYAYGQP
jgi:chromosome segregation ATPase